ncbi:MAG: ABC transporter permease [Deltaproteobacteria bacterium]
MTDYVSILKISLTSLRTNKLRSALTMLGIIIGVSSVITMIAIGNGASESIKGQISSIGGNIIMVVPGSVTSGGMRMGTGSQSTLTKDDAIAIEKECPSVQVSVGVLNGAVQAVAGNQNWSTILYGTTEGYFVAREWNIEVGRLMNEQDEKGAMKVAIVGKTVVENLFMGADPTGQIIRIKKIPFTVIGVLEQKGQSPIGQDQDDAIYIPLATAQKKIFGTRFPGMVRSIVTKARDMDVLSIAEQEINDLLRQRHRISAKQDADFSVRNLTQLMQAAEQSLQTMTILLGAIASISLLVGGIGIMNIMLVSVTERTREIGIRLAVGAKASNIRIQFIIEALILSLIGGAIGVILGIVIAKSISFFAGWATVLTITSVAIAFSFAGLVGIFFGFFPAYKASMLNPIEALRRE